MDAGRPAPPAAAAAQRSPTSPAIAPTAEGGGPLPANSSAGSRECRPARPIGAGSWIHSRPPSKHRPHRSSCACALQCWRPRTKWSPGGARRRCGGGGGARGDSPPPPAAPRGRCCPADSATRRGQKVREVPPRFELGSLDSESRVLTITPWNRLREASQPLLLRQSENKRPRPSRHRFALLFVLPCSFHDESHCSFTATCHNSENNAISETP